jgi:spermidine/putrescine transport system substrate-binding protein
MSDAWISESISRRKLLKRAAVAGAAGIGLAGLSDRLAYAAEFAVEPKKDGDTLNLFAWEGYFDPGVLSGFEKKYGIKINQTYITGPDEFTKVAAGLPFDCCITNSTTLHRLVSAGVLRKLNHGSLPHYDQVIPAFRNPYYDPNGRYSVCYAMAPMGLAYQANHVSGLTGSWSDLWTQAPKIPGHAYMTNTPNEAIGIGLMHLGYNENSNDSAQISKAVAALKDLKPSLAGFVSDNTIQILSSGQAWLIPSYTGNVYTAILKSKNKNIKFELCKEGGFWNADNMSISAHAQHPGNGMLFIDWNLQPANMAKNVKYTGYPVGTSAGLAAYHELIHAYPFLNLPASTFTAWKNWERGKTSAQSKAITQAYTQVVA